MLNLHELESRWLRYKIKSYTPYFIIILSLIVIVMSIVLWPSQKASQAQSDEEKILQEKKKTTEQAQEPKVGKTEESLAQTKQTTEQNYKIQDKIIKNERSTRVLTPSMDFINDIEPTRDIPTYMEQSSVEEVTLEPSLTSQQKQDILEETEQEEVLVEKIEEEEPLKINIHRKNAHADIASVIKRFKKSNNPALSLFIAKKYYELQDYKNAYNYALITNEINRDIESSWIIFAKSLVKLGKKDMAIQTLREYTKDSHSDSARILLDEITSGKFR